MKKFLLVFSIGLLFFSTPLQSMAAALNPSIPENQDSYSFEVEGEKYNLTLVTDGDVQTVYLESEKNGLETASYDRSTDELRFNNELADEEFLGELKETANEISISDDFSISEFSTQADYNWKLVNTEKNSFNVTVATVLVVTGLILLLPTGTGAVMGVVLTAKIIAVLASAIVSASGPGKNTFYYTFKTYYSPLNGYYNNKFVLSVYKDSKRTKLVKTVTHTTRLGKKY